MFSILIQENTLELIAALNEGETPEVQYGEDNLPSTFFVYNNFDDFAIVTREEMCELISQDDGIEPVSIAFWRK